MKGQLNILRHIIFSIALVFIGVSIFSLTIGQIINFEFVVTKTRFYYYTLVMFGFPIAVLLTLLGTIKIKYKRSTNLWTTGLTVISSVIFGIIVFGLALKIGWGSWVNETILYRNKQDLSTKIAYQIWDAGALGYGRHRTVKLTPVFKFWNKVNEIDSVKIDKNEWKFVNEEGDLKFP